MIKLLKLCPFQDVILISVWTQYYKKSADEFPLCNVYLHHTYAQRERTLLSCCCDGKNQEKTTFTLAFSQLVSLSLFLCICLDLILACLAACFCCMRFVCVAWPKSTRRREANLWTRFREGWAKPFCLDTIAVFLAMQCVIYTL